MVTVGDWELTAVTRRQISDWSVTDRGHRIMLASAAPIRSVDGIMMCLPWLQG